MNIKIRDAEKGDNTRIRALQEEIAKLHYEGRPDLFKKEARYYTDEVFEGMLANIDGFIHIAEDESKEIVGYAFAKILRYRYHSTYRDFDMFYIDDICVSEKHRRKGIGGMLFEKCLEQAKLSNCHSIDLGVYSFNTDAIAFYERCGMKERMKRMEITIK